MFPAVPILREYLLLLERVYQTAAEQQTSPLAPLFQLSVVMSQYLNSCSLSSVDEFILSRNDP
jgi:hypothetical protein